MMFNLQRRTVPIDGQDIILVELSAGDFQDLSNEADDNKQGIMMIARSIYFPKVSQEDVAGWPRRVTEELLNNIVSLNGFDAEGN